MDGLQQPELTVLMPCLNEAETLATCIRKARLGVERAAIAAEILVADNGSEDGSREIAEAEGARVVAVAQRGYGAALLAGIAAARGRWIVMGDADDSYDFAELGPFVEELRRGRELVMGCRMPRGGGRIERGAMPWKHRYIGNPILSALGRLLFASPVTDFHCGLRAFSREAVDRLELKTPGMEFASEMVIKATLGGLAISEVPITLHRDGRSRPPHLRSWRDGWRHLRFMLLLSPRWVFLMPGLVAMLVGLGFGGRLLVGPIMLGSMRLDTNTLLVCALAVIVGLQLVLYAVSAEIFSLATGLLPRRGKSRVARLFTLERGVSAGLLILALGVALFARALMLWEEAGFGNLSYPASLRLVIPAVTGIAVGTQVLFWSFFVSALALLGRDGG